MFTPWLWVMATNATEISQTTTWMQQEHSPLSLLGIWLINLSQSFIGHPSKFSWPLILVMAIALVQLVRQERREVWLFLISTLLVNGVAFSLADLFFQTSFSFHGRYLWPIYSVAK